MLSTRFRILLTVIISAGAMTADAADTGIKVSKHTTRFTEPLNDDGTVNYTEAVNRYFAGDIKPEENSAVLIYEVFGHSPEGTRMSDEFFARLGMPVPPADGNYFAGLGSWLQKQYGDKWNDEGRDRYYAVSEITEDGPWQKKDAPEVVKWLNAMDGHLKKLHEAVQRPRYFLPMILTVDDAGNRGLIIGVLLPGVQMTRSLARALNRRANLAMGEGRFDDARKDLLTCIRLGRHTAQGATLIERLVGIAVESIASKSLLKWIELAKPNLKAVNEIRADMASMLPIPDMARSVAVCERAMYLDTVTALAQQRTDLSEIVGLGGDSTVTNTVQSVAGLVVDWNLILRRGNEWYDRMSAAMREPTRPARMQVTGQIEADLKEVAKQVKDGSIWAKALLPGQTKKTISEQMSSALIALLLPAVSAAGTAEDRCTQSHGNLHVALALSAWHREHGSYPAKLEQLSPKYLEDIPEDLFVRGTLKYQQTDDGYLFYSVGPNVTDDDGRWYDDEPSGDDISVRMPIPPPKDDE